ncbi:hypothetical protein EYF80_004253 [Liparis tanakae]|uniref:Uncharacterized protein n=1 Tax=Liparis tanakae TaxID=230148 RepID=A0A4Z2J632_9TELE|nr:hypothetical protein EYF80_004253 [Liparis tanakae]
MVSSSSCCGVCRVACFHGILKRMASRSIHTRSGYRPLSTCATSQGFRRTRRGVTDIPAERTTPAGGMMSSQLDGPVRLSPGQLKFCCAISLTVAGKKLLKKRVLWVAMLSALLCLRLYVQRLCRKVQVFL